MYGSRSLARPEIPRRTMARGPGPVNDRTADDLQSGYKAAGPPKGSSSQSQNGAGMWPQYGAKSSRSPLFAMAENRVNIGEAGRVTEAILPAQSVDNPIL